MIYVDLYLYIYNLYYTLIFNIDDLPIPHGDFPIRLRRDRSAGVKALKAGSVNQVMGL